MARTLSLALAAALSIVASSARANIGAAPVPTDLGPLAAAQTTPIEVVRERLKIECQGQVRAFSCSFEARYELRNPTDKKQEVVAAFFGHGASDVTIRLDNQAAPSASTGDAEQLARDQAAAFGLPQHAVRIALDAQKGANLVVLGRLNPSDLTRKPGYEIDAAYARHIFVSPSTTAKGEDYLIRYLVAPIRTWSGRPSIDLQIVVPRGYRLDEESGYRWSARQDGSRVGVRSYSAGSAPEELALRFEKPPALLIRGGPLLGVGGTFGDKSGLRLKVGWEVAQPSWMLYSLVFETNAKDRHFIVPVVQAASPMVLFLPSLAAGVGVPIQLHPDVRVGGRAQIDAHFGPLGLVLAFDGYPRVSDSSPGMLQVSLLGQAAF